MVAVPRLAAGNPGTLGARAPGIGPGGNLVKLEVALHLRKRDQSQFVRWRSALSNAATLGGLSALLQNQRVPDAEMVNKQFPNLPPEQQQQTLQEAIAGYQAENTALFFIIEPSVVLEGHWELLDREWIQENFVSGDLRDGVSLLKWVESMYDQKSEQGQIGIQNEMKKITFDVRTTQMQLLKSLLDLLSLWKRIGSNNETDAVKLDDFYQLVLNKLPTSPIEAPIVRLRSWFAEKHFEKAGFLSNVRLRGSGEGWASGF